MKAADAVAVLARHRGDAIVVCALGMAANEWWAATRSEDSFYMHGAMGFAASFALGLALAAPATPVWALNADGSLCMNLGCLITESAQRAGNLHHFVIDNGVYQTVGGLPMVGGGAVDFAALARAAGFHAAHTLESVTAVEDALPGILTSPGPVLTVLRVEPESGFLAHRRRPMRGRR